MLLVAMVIAFLIRTFLAQAFYIPSVSMVPQLDRLDRVVVSKVAYRAHKPRRGDVVVFDCPPKAVCKAPVQGRNAVARAFRFVGERVGLVQPSTDEYIKRVIGLPGETVEGRGGHVFVDGRLVVEPYLPEGTVTSDFGQVIVAPGHLWVMGDNRTNSSDSRFFGQVDQKTLVGRAVMKVWPIRHASFL